MGTHTRTTGLLRGPIGLVTLALLAGAPALATTPSPVPETLPPADYQLWLDGGPRGELRMPESLGPWNYVREFGQIVAFLADWQMLDPGPDYGGMIEAEAGPLGGVIQTDNTLEAIWCWSRYREFSGRTTYDPNVAAAWVYCQAYPAWLEEGSVGDDYYRVHNCAWGLTAVLQYEAATGDPSFTPYAETCAEYIVDHSLIITDGTIWQQRLDAFVKGWAAGDLYLYGQARGNPAYMAEAVTQGTDVRNWIDLDPPVNMASEYWAMSSGTCVWGISNSVALDNPGAGAGWLASHAPLMDLWQEWYNVPGYDWDSSWNVAYGNAHFAVWDRTGDERYYRNGVLVTDLLLSLDTDDDGGIVSNTQDPDTEDMCWVTSYLCKFLVDRLMGSPPDHDVGALRFAGFDDGDWLPIGTVVPVAPVVTNYGLSDETGIEVHLEGDAGTGMTMTSLPFTGQEPVVMVPLWQPPAGSYTLTAYTIMAGDQNAADDSVTVTINFYDPVAVNEGGADVAGIIPRALVNPFRMGTGLSIELPGPADLNLDIFDAGGRLIRRIGAPAGPAGTRRLLWDGADARGETVRAGVYLYRLRAGAASYEGKLVKAR